MNYLSYAILKKMDHMNKTKGAVKIGGVDPNNEVVGDVPNQLYYQVADNTIISVWLFTGTAGEKSPWITVG